MAQNRVLQELVKVFVVFVRDKQLKNDGKDKEEHIFLYKNCCFLGESGNRGTH